MRSLLLVLAVGVLGTGLSGRAAEDPPKKFTPEERKQLEAKLQEVHEAGVKQYQAGKVAEAAKTLEEGLGIARRLYPREAYADGHPDLANSLNDLAVVLNSQGKYAGAEPLHREALAMRRRLFQGDHPDLAASLNNLAVVLHEQRKYADAEPFHREALAMCRRLFKGDNPHVADSLYSLAVALWAQEKYADAEAFLREALAMRRRLFQGDHPDLAQSLDTLAGVLQKQRKYAEAETLYREVLAMRRRHLRGDHADLAQNLHSLASVLWKQRRYADAEILYREALAMRQRHVKGDRPEQADNLNSLAMVLQDQGKYADAEALDRDALAMRRRLFQGDHPDLAQSLNNLAMVLWAQGKYAEAEPLCRSALAMRRRLFQGDHPDLAQSMHNLALWLQDQGRYANAEALYREALAMQKRLFQGDHPDVAVSLQSLSSVLREQEKSAEAETLCREALAMHQRLFKGDDPNLADSLNNLALILQDQGRYADAEIFSRDAVRMYQGLFKGDHPGVARSLSTLAGVIRAQGKYADAEALEREALAMRRRLFPGDHTDLAESLNNLGCVLWAQGKYADAEALFRQALAMDQRLVKGDDPGLALVLHNLAAVLRDQGKYPDAEALFRQALAMDQRLFQGDHRDLAQCLNSLGGVLWAQGKYADAETFCRDALHMYRALAETHAQARAEGEALTFLATFPGSEHGYLSCAQALHAPPEVVYPEVWASKGTIARVFERHSLAGRAAASNPRAAALLAQLGDLRRRGADLILAPEPKDPATRRKWEEDVKDLADRIAALDRDLRPLLPALERSDRLARASPAELQKALPSEAVFVDLLSYVLNEQNPEVPGEKGTKRTRCYLAFVVSRGAIRWIDLGPAAPTDEAIALWREAITTPPYTIADLPARVRELVWAPLRREFPDGTRAVYLSPDLNLSRIPWSALPGDKPGRLVLEEFAVAVVPHGPFLLDQLWPQDPVPRQAQQVLVAGGIAYGDASQPADAAPAVVTDSRSSLPLQPGRPLTWGRLPAAADEARAVTGRAARHQLEARLLTGADASAERVLAELPRARFAHLATHGFFADPQFRSVLQLDAKQFERTLRGERVGAGALSPLVLSGLVFAGANRPDTPGRGLLTGEALLDRDLSGLQLAVLSACDTGLGDVAGGEGVFGLQRAFHLAGCRNVIASQWKVNDAATAALMGAFYRALWDDRLPPILALQRAQLAVYRADPGQFRELALRGFGPGDKNLDAAKVVPAAVQSGGRNPPVLWAAFTLSGAGR
jgi:tetratricopeptide (TPR) repeat protein/CHAT domain-containing protein